MNGDGIKTRYGEWPKSKNGTCQSGCDGGEDSGMGWGEYSPPQKQIVNSHIPEGETRYSGGGGCLVVPLVAAHHIMKQLGGKPPSFNSKL